MTDSPNPRPTRQASRQSHTHQPHTRQPLDISKLSKAEYDELATNRSRLRLVGRRRVEQYCAAFTDPPLPGLDLVVAKPELPPEFCSWVAPAPSAGRATRPSLIMSTFLVATSPTYNAMSNRTRPQDAIDTFMKSSAASRAMRSSSLQVHVVHDSPLVEVHTSHTRVGAVTGQVCTMLDDVLSYCNCLMNSVSSRQTPDTRLADRTRSSNTVV